MRVGSPHIWFEEKQLKAKGRVRVGSPHITGLSRHYQTLRPACAWAPRHKYRLSPHWQDWKSKGRQEKGGPCRSGRDLGLGKLRGPVTNHRGNFPVKLRNLSVSQTNLHNLRRQDHPEAFRPIDHNRCSLSALSVRPYCFRHDKCSHLRLSAAP